MLARPKSEPLAQLSYKKLCRIFRHESLLFDMSGYEFFYIVLGFMHRKTLQTTQFRVFSKKEQKKPRRKRTKVRRGRIQYCFSMRISV